MAKLTTKSKGHQVIPMEPAYYTFMLEEITDKNRRRCFENALKRYNKACSKALKVLMKDLDKCKKGK